MNIESVKVFKPTGPLNKVWLMWEVVKTFYSLSDEAHLDAIAALEEQIDEQFADDARSEEKFRTVASLTDQRHLADLSGNILVRAAILHLQTAFIEFAIKEVLKLVLPYQEIPLRPRFMEDLIRPLKEAGAFTEFPPEYGENVSRYREAVRNNFRPWQLVRTSHTNPSLRSREGVYWNRKANGASPVQSAADPPQRILHGYYWRAVV